VCKAINYDSVAEIKTLLASYKAAALHRFGQNFLINGALRQKIVDELNIKPGDVVYEIGGGMGAMTQLLLRSQAKLTVFEIDAVMQNILSNFYGNNPNFNLIKGDVLKTLPPLATKSKVSLKIVGNLPYNIASAIIVLLANFNFSTAIVMVQKELGERLLATTRTKAYSSLSVFCQSYFSLKNVGSIKSGSFYPAPQVSSMLLTLSPQVNSTNFDRPIFDSLLKTAFNSRRKTLNNNWRSFALKYPNFWLLAGQAGLQGNGRAEEFAPQCYQHLAALLKQPT
jgi:16S rRNA (adenine1518-N6/adenine1519-N6)-dimethyltransferase